MHSKIHVMMTMSTEYGMTIHSALSAHQHSRSIETVMFWHWSKKSVFAIIIISIKNIEHRSTLMRALHLHVLVFIGL